MPFFFFFFKQKTAYEISACLVGSEMCIRDRLPPRQQEVFKMSRDEHLTYKEIATRLNISEKTVERHINEAIKFLKKNIMLYLIFIF